MPRSPSPPPSALPLTPTDERPRLPSIKELLRAGELLEQAAAEDASARRRSSIPAPDLQTRVIEAQAAHARTSALSDNMRALRIDIPPPPAHLRAQPHPQPQPHQPQFFHQQQQQQHAQSETYYGAGANREKGGAPVFHNPFQPGVPVYAVSPGPSPFGSALGLYAPAAIPVPQQRSLRACAECRRRKVKCTTIGWSPACTRCGQLGIPCVGQPTAGERKAKHVEPAVHPGPVRHRRSHESVQPYARPSIVMTGPSIARRMSYSGHTAQSLQRSSSIPIVPISVYEKPRSNSLPTNSLIPLAHPQPRPAFHPGLGRRASS